MRKLFWLGLGLGLCAGMQAMAQEHYTEGASTPSEKRDRSASAGALRMLKW
jgi:hypothetical protein